MAKEETKAERKRARLGTWERFVDMIEVPGCKTPVPAPQIRVTYEGIEWVVGDTKEGRKIATDGIHAVQERERRIHRVERARQAVADAVADLPTDATGGDPGVALAALDDLIDAMRGSKHD
jgi:hypothetical protein